MPQSFAQLYLVFSTNKKVSFQVSAGFLNNIVPNIMSGIFWISRCLRAFSAHLMGRCLPGALPQAIGLCAFSAPQTVTRFQRCPSNSGQLLRVSCRTFVMQQGSGSYFGICHHSTTNLRSYGGYGSAFVDVSQSVAEPRVSSRYPVVVGGHADGFGVAD